MKKYTITDILPDSIDRESWELFVDNRNEIGHPLTPSAVKGIFKKLSKYPPQIQNQALDTANQCNQVN